MILALNEKKFNLATRFRGFLPVVVDLETTGLNPLTDGLLEIAAVTINMDAKGRLFPHKTYFYAVESFVGANQDPESLLITGIDPEHPFRFALTEQQALHATFSRIQKHVEEFSCQRAVLVGHNAWFDLAFLQSATKRCKLDSSPFHAFTSLDTATLAAVGLGETVLAKALKAAKIHFNVNRAHSAKYDAEKTAELFCWLVNRLEMKG
jgi:ribonuclease T